jgi:hypothetical protein
MRIKSKEPLKLIMIPVSDDLFLKYLSLVRIALKKLRLGNLNQKSQSILGTYVVKMFLRLI